MASTLSCIGLGVDDEEEFDRLLGEIVPASERIGRQGGVDVRRWQDPSGARVELEENRLLPGDGHPGGRASLVALGLAVTVHADAESFAASPDSLLDPDADVDTASPEHAAVAGIARPLRMGGESFVSYGASAVEGDPLAEARLAATVLGAEPPGEHGDPPAVHRRARAVG